ncbi:hypothetical protein RhiirA4_487618, partial [Rhizophagus irregularis]
NITPDDRSFAGLELEYLRDFYKAEEKKEHISLAEYESNIMQVYSSYCSIVQVLLLTHIHFYSSASYTFQEENGEYQKLTFA